ncbi:hypothetical protein [Streptomyces sp. CBMA123]|uniref:hypothetical protein n=1 Tax=Streptomyces sp. CBMA123 TaxID=1896313 RepID=UPI001661C499|nr:hypothetical protein [Streptomyces sp. CBMA123]MBD0691358.1 hypothetical protein [Streptomyces sp. CBMA123]
MRSTAPRTRRAVVLAASGLAAAALVAGCGSSGSGSSGSGSSGAGTSSPPSPPSGSGAPAAVTLQTAHDPRLGAIVTDGAGFTLYRFDQDQSNPSDSYCNGNCATLWPPEHADGDVTVKGIDSKLVGSFTRDDGTKQVTVNGWPVYRYSPDAKPGDTKGEGVAGSWFAVTPTGGKAMPGTSSTPSTPAPANPTPRPSTPAPGY